MPNRKQPSSGRWSQDRRLEFIDFRLRWDGRLNRGDLTDFFGISIPQASLDIAAYLERAPNNAAYDNSARVYLATDEFEPFFPGSTSARYLNELLGTATGVLPLGDSFIGWQPPVAVAPVPARSFSVNVLTAVLKAIREKSGLEITYQSMSRPEPTARVVSPHALAYDGFRWHMRAYCQKREDFLDFVIARILDVKDAVSVGPDASSDTQWHMTVKLILQANPQLSEARRRVVELDYGMENGEVTFECRQALLFYALKQLGLEEKEIARPEEQQIVLKNQEEVESLRTQRVSS